MATVLKTIQKAYRRSGVLAAGVNLSKVQTDVGFERIQDMYLRMSDGMFGSLHPKILTSNAAYTACEFQRIYNDQGATITLPIQVRDDAVCGGFRPPVDMCLVVVTVPGVDPVISVFDPDRAEWQNLNTITLSGYAPLTARYADGIADMLAAMIADDMGVPISKLVAQSAALTRQSLAGKFGSARAPARTDYY